jgi:dTDP-glucose 4,6-dehydratase
LNEPLTIHGKGKAERDWVYVEDFCEAVDKTIHCPLKRVKGQVINIGTGKSTSIKTIAEMIIEKMGASKKLITYIEDRPGQVLRHKSSTALAKKLLGWKAKTTLEKGLDKTIEWYKNNREWWEKQLWMRKIPIRLKDGRIIYH